MLVEVSININDAGQSAERYLRKYFVHMSLDRLQSLFRRKEIKIGRKPILRTQVLHAGDFVQVYGIRPEDLEPVEGAAEKPAQPQAEKIPAWLPQPFSISILHEDKEILVLDKPGGMAVHPGTGIDPGHSLIEKVWEYLAPERSVGEIFQPSLVHRLDKDTSGVIMVAKTGGSLRRLNSAMRDGSFYKRYLALVEGVLDPPNGEISGLLQRVDSRTGGAKAEVSEADGKWSITRYKTVKEFGNFSLLGVIIETGRMHQIRAHLAHAGHPLAGDPRYGDFEKNRSYKKKYGLRRTFLHAADLVIDLGTSGKKSFHSPLPKDLSGVIDKLKAESQELS